MKCFVADPRGARSAPSLPTSGAGPSREDESPDSSLTIHQGENNTTRTKTTKSAVDTAQRNLTDVQTTIASLTGELAKLEQEHQQIE